MYEVRNGRSGKVRDKKKIVEKKLFCKTNISKENCRKQKISKASDVTSKQCFWSNSFKEKSIVFIICIFSSRRFKGKNKTIVIQCRVDHLRKRYCASLINGMKYLDGFHSQWLNGKLTFCNFFHPMICVWSMSR